MSYNAESWLQAMCIISTKRSTLAQTNDFRTNFCWNTCTFPVSDVIVFKQKNKKKRASYYTMYFVRTQEKKLIRVCVDAFINILHVSRFRLNNIADQYHRNGFTKDHRGGFQQTQKEKYDAQKEDVKSFIKLHLC